jgi:hypothetical protein
VGFSPRGASAPPFQNFFSGATSPLRQRGRLLFPFRLGRFLFRRAPLLQILRLHQRLALLPVPGFPLGDAGGTLLDVQQGEVQTVFGGLDRLRQREFVTRQILGPGVLDLLEKLQHFLFRLGDRGEPLVDGEFAPQRVVGHRVDGLDDLGVVVQRVVDQHRAPGLLLGQDLPQQFHPLAGELSIEHQPLVRLLSQAHLVDFVGGQEIAALLAGRRHGERKTHCQTPEPHGCKVAQVESLGPDRRPGRIHHRDPSHHCILDHLHSFQFFRCQLDRLSSLPGATEFRCS